MSAFDTPQQQRFPPGMFQTPASAVLPRHSAGFSYPTLPSELHTPIRSYSGASAQQFQAPEQQQQPQRPIQQRQAPIASGAVVPGPRAHDSGSDSMAPVQRAAKTIDDTLEAEKRYPQLDDIVSQGQSSEYEIPQTYGEPYARTATHTIPDAIFEQYNRATSHTLMGLFAELKQAWITVDNRLYMWDYTTQGGFQGFEGQANTITSVKLVNPKPGVFVKDVNYILVVGTVNDVFLLGIQAEPNDRGSMDVSVFTTDMSVPTRGLDVTIIEGSNASGRIFFGGKTDNDIYELTYRAEERWFHGRCGKVNHTNKGASAFAPRLPLLFSAAKEPEYVKQIVIDDTRNLLYTLSSLSTIRAFQLQRDGGLTLSLTHSFQHILQNIRVMVGNTPHINNTTPLISISTVSMNQARRTHLIATTKSGCRLFMSAVASEYGFGGTDSAPSSMQVIHIRYPPPSFDVKSSVRRAKVFSPGFFFCFLEQSPTSDDLMLTAPDPAKIMMLSEGGGTTRLQLIEQGMLLPLESRVEACECVDGLYVAAHQIPAGYGNELATQFDLKPTEIAILTNSGVHIVKRRRLVEVFDALLRSGGSAQGGVDGEVRKFFETYGRAEGCASALAVACGASTEGSATSMPARVTDTDVHDSARKFFIEFGGKPRADNVFDASALPSLDSIKISGRAEGLALYVSRIIRPIWKIAMIEKTLKSTGGVTYISTMETSKLRTIQDQLLRLAAFLQQNRSFIVGLSGAESLMAAGSKVEEVALQAEHRMLHSLMTLIEGMIEGISFVLFLFDDKLDDIMLSLPELQRDAITQTTYGNLFSTHHGQALAKELVTAIVNRNIAAGSNVDTIADALRRRCGSFCSADDVVIFKAIEHIRRAKEEKDQEAKHLNLRESLRLFEQTAGSLPMDNLTEAVTEYRRLDYYPGSVQLSLTVARESDRANLALKFIDDLPTEEGDATEHFVKRQACYGLVFDTLERLDRAAASQPEMIDGMPSPMTKLRNETWTIVYSSADQLFHCSLYDWLFGKRLEERLLEIDSPFVLKYLELRGKESIEHCDLLWQYHARRDNFYEAAQVLHELAQSEFKLNLEKRLEFFSRARGFCNSYGALGTRQRMNELSQTIQEELDVALVQHEVLKKIRDDARISDVKKQKLELELGNKLLSLSDIFNKYADPYGYMDTCLAIFQAADFRGTNEIRKCWEQLITQTHARAVETGDQAPFEMVADDIRRLGSRFANSEYIFPPSDLVPLLEIYAYEQQRDVGPPGWVAITLIDAGIAEETLLRVLEEMFWRDEVPFRGGARRRLLSDAILIVEKWWNKVLRRNGAEGFSPGQISSILQGMASSLPGAREEQQMVERLLAEMARRAL